VGPDETGDSRQPAAKDVQVPRGLSRAMTRRRLLGVGGMVALGGCTVRRGSGTSAARTTSRPSSRPTISRPGTTTPDTPPGESPTYPPTPASAAPRKTPATEVSRGTGTRPEVALTFHGAGNTALASAILDVARTHHAQVTVMAVGNWLAANQPVAARILSDGSELGNHTWTHPVLRDLDRTHAYAEIYRCRTVIERLTGSPGRWFRQSGSRHSTPLIRELAGRAGYPVCLSYDIDSLDWTDPGPSAVVHNVRAATAGSIVSMHLGHPGTLTALPEILRELDARGLRAVTVSQLLAP
jgi:peptidoglycan/xylan/chitin deacetylase (PgdA/CDA1 family)